eukprot:37754_1
MPHYMRHLVKKTFQSVTSIALFPQSETFLLKLFRSLFYYDYGWIKLDVLTTLFPSLENIYFDDQKNNDKFMEHTSIYKSVLSLLINNANQNLNSIVIVLPGKSTVFNRAQTIHYDYIGQFKKLHWIIFIEKK